MGAAKKLSRYDLNRCIARGGMGSVYVGVQRGAAGFERPVAIKRTHAHLLSDPETREVILREARNASAVRHPNVVSIDDVEEVDGELFLVMDYIDGGSFSSLSASKKAPLGVALRIVLDAALGLEAIHSAKDRSGDSLGLIHRDVSPQNILVGLDGVARVTDFGIAKGKADPTRTQKTMRRGKFGYMAPEYVLTGAASKSSDVFGLGVVLWEAIAQRRLFDGESNIDSLRRNMVCEVPSLRSIRKDVPTMLDVIVLTALGDKPECRYASMREMVKAIERNASNLLASHVEVAVWVKEAEEASAKSVASTVKAETVALDDEDMLSDDMELVKETDTGMSAVRSESPRNELASGAFPTSLRHRKFDLETALSSENVLPVSGITIKKNPVQPLAIIKRPATQPASKLSNKTIVLFASFSVAVVAVTSVLAYAGLVP